MTNEYIDKVIKIFISHQELSGMFEIGEENLYALIHEVYTKGVKDAEKACKELLK